MAKMYRKYERMLESGEFESENELCNALGLNYDDLYEDEIDDDDEFQPNDGMRKGRAKVLFPDAKRRRK